MSDLDHETTGPSLDIAVIGMSGRFPGSPDIATFWRNLCAGVESIAMFSDEEALADGASAEELRQPHYVKAGGVLEGVELFDASFFGLYPREAEVMDPQQRVLLECAWEALESAGYNPQAYPGLIGVYAGAGMPSYLLQNLLTNRAAAAGISDYQIMLSNDKDFLATRISYKLNLRGPSMSVQTACSTSLVAVHLACQALLGYQCDMALAGGVTIRLPQKRGYQYQEGGITSPDGHCRPFDADAAGTVGSNGAGVVLLKRLEDARADGDTIYALIKGSAINNDGSNKIGYTAPSVDGQTEVIATAQSLAGVSPETISYIETHGTGTPLGDPIEIAALSQVFRAATDHTGFCAIGSLKSNIGHLDTAAGVAGLIKTALALHHRQIPPSLNYTRPNPQTGLASSPFYVNTTLAEWPAGETPRRAGVSSFGIGGTNVHVVMEEAPARAASDPGRAWQLVTLSARSPAALEQISANLADHLRDNPGLDLADVAYTLQVGRQAFAHRRTVVGQTLEEIAEALETLDARRLATGQATQGRTVAFMFTGQGAQYVGMAAGLYAHEAVFREHLDACAELLMPHLGRDIRDLIFADPAGDAAQQQLARTEFTQPALFAVEYALAQLWIAWGLVPDAMIGHSVGEYVAACIAGVLTLEDALALVAARGRLMQSLPGGAMLSVHLPEAQIRPLLGTQLALAAVNGPELCVVSGSYDAVAALERQLNERGTPCRRLHTSHAFHSAMMDPILAPFGQLVKRARLSAPQIPFVSNVTGTWITVEDATSPTYWTSHLRQTVRFADGLKLLMADPARALLEVGPGQTLATFARRHPAYTPERVVVNSLRHPQDTIADETLALATLGRLWIAGTKVDWAAYSAGQRRARVPLPTYPFERQRYWISPGTGVPSAAPADPLRRTQPGSWLYAPSWRRANLTAPGPDLPAVTLILCEADGLGQRLAERLQLHDRTAVCVFAGDQYAANLDDSYTLDPARADDYLTLLADLAARGRTPDAVVHLWSATAERLDMETAQTVGGQSLLLLGRALARRSQAPTILAVSSGALEVVGDEPLAPERATLHGVCRVLPQELPGASCRSIDIVTPGAGSALLTRLASQLVDELATPAGETTVAYRGGYRWVQFFAELATTGGAPAIRAGGTYLITGGLGRMGMTIAHHLARSARAQIALIGRTARRDAQVDALEQIGSRVLVLAADVADVAAFGAAVARVEAAFGPIHGVFHTAGLVGPDSLRPLADASREDYQRHMRPKGEGSLALAEVLRGRELDFVVLTSSLAAVLGGVGMAAYAAANAFEDAFAHTRRQAGQPWLSISWDGWRFAEEQATLAALHTGSDLTIEPAEGMAVLDRILAQPVAAQILVSTAELNARVAAAQHSGSIPSEPPVTLHARPAAAGGYVAPHTELEQGIATMWQTVLGIAEVGANDNFFDLGGHSLLATQVISRLRDIYQVELPLRQLFENPTVAGLAALIEAQRSPAPDMAPAAILPVSRTGDLPISFGQQRMWFLDQLEPGSPLYNNPAAVRLNGVIDPALVERSLNRIVARHEVLRTVYTGRTGRPAASVLPEQYVPVPVVDLSGLEPGARDDELRRLARIEAQSPFNLATGPMLRLTLVRTGAAEHVALLTMHHIVSDGLTVGVLIHELLAGYLALAEGREPDLPALPIQYADYAAWQQSQLQGATLQHQLDYWTALLSGIEGYLELPTDRPRPAIQSIRGATRWLAWPRELASGLETLARQENATLFMALLAGFEALLHRYSGQDSFCIGTPIAGRTRAETEPLIGFFVNTLVMRADLADNPTFRELLGRVRETALGAYAHQDVPFEMLVDALQPTRDLSRTPLFQVMFVLQDAQLPALNLPGLSATPLEIDTGTAKFDLTLYLEQTGAGLRGWLNYNSDLFDEATIARMEAHLRILLDAALARPDLRIGELPLLTADEQELLVTWNDTGAGTMEAAPIHRTIEARVALRPEAIAVECDDTRLSYAELNARANQLAHHLQTLGVGPETMVGVCLERSVDAIVALLAIFKAGGAYLPLDPAFPAERLAFMLADAQPVAVITHGTVAAALGWGDGRKEYLTVRPGEHAHGGMDGEGTGGPREHAHGGLRAGQNGHRGNGHAVPGNGAAGAGHGQPFGLAVLPSMIHLDSDWPRIASQPDTNLEDEPAREHLAYVIYTSGSTGTPKGVMVEYGMIADHCRDIVGFYGLTAADGVLQFASLNFDASIEQILPTLMAGAKLVLRGPDVWDPAEFHLRAARHGLTVINPPTAYWHQLVHTWAQHPEHCPREGIRLVIAGGDAMRAEAVALWHTTPLAGVRLLNAYGPTETTITATTYEVPGPGTPLPARMPIGRPLPNRRAYLLDRNLQPVPVGAVGELYLGGLGVARGYLHRPELTAERFVEIGGLKDRTTEGLKDRTTAEGPDSGTEESSAILRSYRLPQRLYRTGDLGRYLADGTIEFLGRADDQVKIRGFRVEPGEVEAALGQHPQVREAVVLAREDTPGEKRLVAYVVAREDASPEAQPGASSNGVSVDSLRSHLRTRIPEYAIPAAFVLLDELPLTPGGKLNRRALPPPDASALVAGSRYVAPRNPIEAELAGMMASVLGLPRVGVFDSFFDLGGHSLLATQLLARIRETYHVDLPLRRLFETPTVAVLADLLAQAQVASVDEADLEALLSDLEGLSEAEAHALFTREVGQE